MFFRSQINFLAQILLIGSLGLGMSGTLSAEENEISEVPEKSIHQSEVNRVLSSPLVGNIDLDWEVSPFSQKNRAIFSSKNKISKTSSLKIQNSTSSSFTQTGDERWNQNGNLCLSVLRAVDFGFGSALFSFLTEDVSASRMAHQWPRVLENSSVKKDRKNGVRSIFQTGSEECSLVLHRFAGENSCSFDREQGVFAIARSKNFGYFPLALRLDLWSKEPTRFVSGFRNMNTPISEDQNSGPTDWDFVRTFRPGQSLEDLGRSPLFLQRTSAIENWESSHSEAIISAYFQRTLRELLSCMKPSWELEQITKMGSHRSFVKNELQEKSNPSSSKKFSPPNSLVG
ncbi:hypothetical protein DLM75_15585 [Leptospira stimsonii]|uniref:Uncharacterized protein n=1 Tax=Leptospira stimsonii TaxID=2202203 RepID=A0A396Z804_9LEPT|nr:hypothetical protein DLM75_15585 [Leptospira stimsonii]